jgi:Tfp pilus assembly protein PilV
MHRLEKKNATRPSSLRFAAAGRRRKGLSIIEVVTASVLLIVAMVPILRSLTKAHMYSVEVVTKTQSLILAQKKLDEIKASSVYHYSDSFTASDTVLTGSYLCDVTDDGDSTLRTVTVSAGFDQDGDSALSSGEYEVTLATKIAKRW